MSILSRAEIKQQLEEKEIDIRKIQEIHKKLQNGEISETSFVLDKNTLRPPTEKDYTNYNNINIEIPERVQRQLNERYGLSLSTSLSKEDCEQLGKAAIKMGELGLLWLNGGAATRYFDMSKVTPEEKERFAEELKALGDEPKKPKGVTKVIDTMSYLELKVLNLLKIQKEIQPTRAIPVITMNSFITDALTEEHLAMLCKKYPDLMPSQFHKVVQQPTMPRWTNPTNRQEIDLYTDKNEKLSFAPGGHGDFLKLIQDFFEKNKLSIKYLFFANIDNFGATIDPVILGIHIASQKGRTVELAPKHPGDKGGAPCFVGNELKIVEQMKFPDEFDQDQIGSFNTNTFWFTLQDLLAFHEELPLILAEKNVNGDSVLQLEHLACDVHLPTEYVNTIREERFWPTKRYVDLLIFKDPNPKNDDEAKQHQEFQLLLEKEYGIKIA